jgi:hypothetical protein
MLRQTVNAPLVFLCSSRHVVLLASRPGRVSGAGQANFADPLMLSSDGSAVSADTSSYPQYPPFLIRPLVLNLALSGQRLGPRDWGRWRSS